MDVYIKWKVALANRYRHTLAILGEGHIAFSLSATILWTAFSMRIPNFKKTHPHSPTTVLQTRSEHARVNAFRRSTVSMSHAGGWHAKHTNTASVESEKTICLVSILCPMRHMRPSKLGFSLNRKSRFCFMKLIFCPSMNKITN